MRENKGVKTIGRRNFLKTGINLSAGMAVGTSGFQFLASPAKANPLSGDFRATIPLPIQVVIDDVGWWSGTDGSRYQEPYRSGIDRDHVPADYAAIAELGKALGIRPQAAMVLCEWDKDNILRKLPTATWMGKKWDNKKWVGPWMEEAADIIRNNKQHLELTLHGIGHEYWTDDQFTRAEWADVNGTMRPRDQVEKHLDFFGKIMDQHQLGPFPTSFVPTAFNHGFGPTPGHDISMAEILSRRGIKYINTPFRQMHNAKAINHDYFGFDSDVLTVDRGADLLDWNVTGVPPSGNMEGPTCGMHWANLIHPDPEQNLEIVQEWVKLLAPYQKKEDTMLSPDPCSFQSQLLYHTCTKIRRKENDIVLDFRELDALPEHHIKNEFTLKVKAQTPLKFQFEDISMITTSLQKRERYSLYTLKLKRGKEKISIISVKKAS